MTVFRDSLSGLWLNETWGSSHRRRSLWYNLSMSEKVGSGGSSLEELEQEQVLLDWQDLPSFGRAENGVQAGSTEATKTDRITETSDTTTEQQARERLSARARGELLLRATAESLPIEEARERKELESGVGGDADALASVIEGENVDGGVDTVVLRAEQALGREQFLTLVYDLGDLAYTEEPDEVMRKFREEAQKYSAIDAGDLWEAAVRQAKVEYFGGPEDRAEMKFYYSTSLDNLKDILRSGKLTRQDGESSPLKSDLKFSYDRKTPEGWQSGFASERDAKSHEVTLVFDSSLIDEESFMAFGKNPSASMVDWEKSCLGVVVDPGADAVDMQRIVRRNGGDLLPMYLSVVRWGDGELTDWSSNMYSAMELRKNAELFEKQRRHLYTIMGEIYGGYKEEVGQQQIERSLTELEEKLDDEALRGFAERHRKIDSVEGRRELCEDLLQYFAKINGIDIEESAIIYIDDEDSETLAECDPYTGEITLNEARFEDASWGDYAETLSHETRHKYQLTRQAHYRQALLEGKEGEEPKYDELCYYNYFEYIRPEWDYCGYREQFVEREAWAYGQAVRRRCDRVEEMMNAPRERARRAAKALGGKIIDLSKKVRKNG